MNSFEKALLGDMEIPLADASAFFVNARRPQIVKVAQMMAKTAGWQDPPDETGVFEGQFEVPVEFAVQLMGNCAMKLLRLINAGFIYVKSVRGPFAGGVKRAIDSGEWDHRRAFEYLVERMTVLLGAPHIPEVDMPPPSTEPIAVAQRMIRAEQEMINSYHELLNVLGQNPMKEKVKCFMGQCQEHLDSYWMAMPPDAGNKPMTPRPPDMLAKHEEHETPEQEAIESPEFEAAEQQAGVEPPEHHEGGGMVAQAAHGFRKTADIGLANVLTGTAMGTIPATASSAITGALMDPAQRLNSSFMSGAGAFAGGALGGAVGGALGTGAAYLSKDPETQNALQQMGAFGGSLLGSHLGSSVATRARTEALAAQNEDLRRLALQQAAYGGGGMISQASAGQTKTAAARYLAKVAKEMLSDNELKETGRQRAVANISAEHHRESARRGERMGKVLGALGGAAAGGIAGHKLSKGGVLGTLGGAALGAHLGHHAGGELGTEADIARHKPKKESAIDKMAARMARWAVKLADDAAAGAPEQEAPMASPTDNQELEPTNYMHAEQLGRQMQSQNEASYYRKQVQQAQMEAQQQVQAAQAQVEQIQQQAAQAMQDAQTADTKVKSALDQALQAKDDALKQTETAAQLRIAQQDLRMKLMELASQDPNMNAAMDLSATTGGASEQEAAAAAPPEGTQGPAEGVPPDAGLAGGPPNPTAAGEGGGGPPGGPAGASPDQQTAPGAAPPAGSPDMNANAGGPPGPDPSMAQSLPQMANKTSAARRRLYRK